MRGLRIGALVAAVTQVLLGAGTDERTAAVLQSPGSSWAVELRPAEVEFGRPQSAPGGKVWVAGDGLEPGFSVFVVLEPTPRATSDEDCRELFGERLEAHDRRPPKRSSYDGMPTLEYEVRQHAGIRLRQRHLHAYLFRDGVCVELHLAQVDFRSRDRRRFEATLDSVAIVEAQPSGE